MNPLIQGLIILFSILLVFSFIERVIIPQATYVPFYNSRVEGMDTMAATTDASGNPTTTYQEYDPNNALILATKNAGNIEYLKSKIAGYDKMNSFIFDLSANVTNLDDQVTQILQNQLLYAQQNLPAQPPVITGLSTTDDGSGASASSFTNGTTPPTTTTDLIGSTGIS
jgi:hypothetical protein